MYKDTMDDFRNFLQDYRNVWNQADAEGILSMYANDIKIRWAQPGNKVRDEDFSKAAQSWKQAIKHYAGKNPRWHFEDVTSAPISENEAFVAFWVTFELDGKPADTRAFFVEAFRRDAKGWKKIRSHVEYQLPIP
jgi:ketosteroid isomerase-like protein